MMDELIVKALVGEATEFEGRQLQRWRSESPENERQYQEIQFLWVKAGEGEGGEDPSPPPLMELVREAERRRARSDARRARRAILRSPWLGYGFMAAAVLVLALALSEGRDVPPQNSQAFSATESSIGPGDVLTMSLSDGSVVRVGPQSRLEFPPQSEGRELVLEGKAFFAVAPEELPFVVRTQHGAVRVHGTRFEVMTDERTMRVAVVEGRVLVSGEDGETELYADQVAFLSVGSPPRIEEGSDVFSYLDWPGGLLVFKETPLSQVAQEIGRHFTVEVRVTGEELGRRRITAWFEDEALEEVISGICLVAGTRCQVTDSIVRVGQ